MSALTDLIARLEAATEGSAELDRAIMEAVGWRWQDSGGLLPDGWCVPDGKPLGWRRIVKTSETWPYTRDTDCAMTLVPERGDGGLLWRVILERKPVHSGPAWIAEVREHAKSGGEAVAHTAPLALCAAALLARSA